jgi:hypothetical protein
MPPDIRLIILELSCFAVKKSISCRGAPVPIALPMVRLCSIKGDELGTAGEKRNNTFRFTLCKTVSLLGKFPPF